MACGINLKEGVHILVRTDDGNAISDENGNWLIMDLAENTMTYVSPTEELLAFFNISTNVSTVTLPSTSNPETNQEYTRERLSQWSRHAILSLALYKEHQIYFKNNSVKNDKVWGMVQEKLNNEGFLFSKSQIENKFKYVKSRYLKKKDNERIKGTGESPISFDYYEEFDTMFANNPYVKPPSVASSLEGFSSSPVSTDSEPEKEPPIKKGRLEKHSDHLNEIFSNQTKNKELAQEKRHNQRQKTMERAIDVYERMMEKLIEKL